MKKDLTHFIEWLHDEIHLGVSSEHRKDLIDKYLHYNKEYHHRVKLDEILEKIDDGFVRYKNEPVTNYIVQRLIQGADRISVIDNLLKLVARQQKHLYDYMTENPPKTVIPIEDFNAFKYLNNDRQTDT